MHADLVIIGGGLFGCSTAYHYCKLNQGKRVILLERSTLSNASSSRAAALITRLRTKRPFIPLSLRTYEAIAEMESMLGESLGATYPGVMHVASAEEHVRGLDELTQTAADFNLPAEWITPAEAHAKSPWLDTSTVSKVVFTPGEGWCDPYLLGTFYGRCARQLGADIRQDVEVTSLLHEGGTVKGVQTSEGSITAGCVVLATGAWAPILAGSVGVSLPMAAVRSQYWITDRSPIFPEHSPIVLLPDVQSYARPNHGALLFGIRERNSLVESPDRIPNNVEDYQFSPDRGMTDLTEVIDKLAQFFPEVYDIPLKHYIAGFSCYTPDNYLSMGVPSGVNNLLMATGCVGAGVSVSGGVGLAFAELAAGRKNPYDFSAFSLDRFGPIDPFNPEWLKRCADARARKTSG
ncbi:MAG: NAD(P)/FAD-dependent oxidoreductase [Bacteroidota bacterium]